jgi:hypothetical protein
MDDIPRVKPEKSTDINSEECEYHDGRNEKPGSHIVKMSIPVCMHKLEWCESCDEASKGSSRYKDDIEMDILWESPKMDKVREYIKSIRKEEKPE